LGRGWGEHSGIYCVCVCVCVCVLCVCLFFLLSSFLAPQRGGLGLLSRGRRGGGCSNTHIHTHTTGEMDFCSKSKIVIHPSVPLLFFSKEYKGGPSELIWEAHLKKKKDTSVSVLVCVSESSASRTKTRHEGVSSCLILSFLGI